MFLSNAMSWSRLSWYQTPRTSTTPSMTTRRNLDRKSTRLNSSHSQISYAVFCLKKKNGSGELDRRQLSPTPRSNRGYKSTNIRAYRIIVVAGASPGGAVVIRFGPSGIPLSCKGRTLRDGIEDIHNLGLTAMEVQLVRVNLNERYAGDEDLGRTLREIPGELVVQIGRKEDRKEVLVSSLDEEIEKGDVLYSLASGIAGDYHELEELGTLARELDIELSLHTPS